MAMRKFIFLTAAVLLVGTCGGAFAQEKNTVVFLNAESPARAKNWSGERSTEHVSEGKYSMKRVFKVIKTDKGIRRPSLSVYGGFPVWPCDLTPYSEMKLDVYNPQDATYKLQCAFKDKYQYSHQHYYGMADVPAYPDGKKPERWGGIVHLEVKPGWNHLSFSLDEIKQRTGIEWSYIHHYWMWLPEIEEDATLYFDNMRLVRRDGEAGKLSRLWSPIQTKQDEHQKILYSFDSRYELWQWDWSGRKYIVAKPGVTEGTGAMQVHFGDLGPKKWDYSARFGVGLTSWGKRGKRHEWTGYKSFKLDVHNPSTEVRDVRVTFTTQKSRTERKEVSRSAKVNPGDNTLTLDLAALAAEGLDLANVTHFNVVPKRLADGTFGWLVLDNMRLTKD
ncbi:MAG: hypothetical protein AMS16_04670 [Planctomycetes bacterium DG_58]|nr:MAG: hypothetical protein AMS16_04670 [Planctomycetes bacterium DG_58]